MPGTRIPDAAAFAATCRGALRTAWDQLALPANEFAEEDAASLPDQLHGFPIIRRDVFSLVNSDYILVVWPCPNSQLFAFSLNIVFLSLFFCLFPPSKSLLLHLCRNICNEAPSELSNFYRATLLRYSIYLLSLCR